MKDQIQSEVKKLAAMIEAKTDEIGKERDAQEKKILGLLDTYHALSVHSPKKPLQEGGEEKDEEQIDLEDEIAEKKKSSKKNK